MATLLLNSCSNRKNVVIVTEPDKVVVQDTKDNQERLFVGQSADQFQFLRTGDTIEVHRFGIFSTLRYKNYRVFTNSQYLGVTDKSLDIASVRFVKQSMQTNEKQR